MNPSVIFFLTQAQDFTKEHPQLKLRLWLRLQVLLHQTDAAY